MIRNSIYRNFADNLRALANDKGSIADTCRALGINRQQFNKYLAGTGLPSKDILKRIAEHFEVEETVLVQDPLSMTRERTPPVLNPVAEILKAPKEFQRVVGSILGSNSSETVREGVYEIYYPWPADSTLVVRSVVVVFRINGTCFFKRFTRLKGSGSPQKRYPAGCHSGIVVDNRRGLFFLGRNERGYGELSLLSFGESRLSKLHVWFGVALIMTPWSEAMSLRCTMVYRGDKSNFKRLFRSASIGPVGATNIEPEIYESIVAPLTSTQPQMQSYQPHKTADMFSF